MVFFVAGSYLAIVGAVMRILPGSISMTAGSPLLNGLELSGPYMFLFAGAFGGLIGFGLLKLNNWARRAAIIVSLLGMIMLVPTVSAAATSFSASLWWNGLGVVVRVVIVWYLWQAPVTQVFEKRASS